MKKNHSASTIEKGLSGDCSSLLSTGSIYATLDFCTYELTKLSFECLTFCWFCITMVGLDSTSSSCAFSLLFIFSSRCKMLTLWIWELLLKWLYWAGPFAIYILLTYDMDGKFILLDSKSSSGTSIIYPSIWILSAIPRSSELSSF